MNTFQDKCLLGIHINFKEKGNATVTGIKFCNIYRGEETGFDANEIPLKNTGCSIGGNTVYSSTGRRNTTVG